MHPVSFTLCSDSLYVIPGFYSLLLLLSLSFFFFFFNLVSTGFLVRHCMLLSVLRPSTSNHRKHVFSVSFCSFNLIQCVVSNGEYAMPYTGKYFYTVFCY